MDEKSNDIIMSQTNSGCTIFTTNTQNALLYRRGSPKKCTNISCSAEIECFAHSDGFVIGIWTEGIHIRVPLADIAAVVDAANKTLKGFGGKDIE